MSSVGLLSPCDCRISVQGAHVRFSIMQSEEDRPSRNSFRRSSSDTARGVLSTGPISFNAIRSPNTLGPGGGARGSSRR